MEKKIVVRVDEEGMGYYELILSEKNRVKEVREIEENGSYGREVICRWIPIDIPKEPTLAEILSGELLPGSVREIFEESRYTTRGEKVVPLQKIPEPVRTFLRLTFLKLEEE